MAILYAGFIRYFVMITDEMSQDRHTSYVNKIRPQRLYFGDLYDIILKDYA